MVSLAWSLPTRKVNGGEDTILRVLIWLFCVCGGICDIPAKIRKRLHGGHNETREREKSNEFPRKKEQESLKKEATLFFSQTEKKNQKQKQKISNTNRALLLFAAPRPRVFGGWDGTSFKKKKWEEKKKKCSMQDDYVAQIASMLVALDQRRSFYGL